MTSLPATYVAPLLIMKVSQQRRSLLANINFISLCPVIKVYCVIINRIVSAVLLGNQEQWQPMLFWGSSQQTTPEDLFIWKSMAPGRSVILNVG